ncbi:gamma-glutamyltransferase [Mailhella massiliensis]|uniref:Glutathione hydrolase proenzyme n=1 Tax=Mailhella massiliensis TaxID=1903261 RepID=A0A921AX53_9BACT|nr:gamma-glutamyltransferase [Mailhella massiliensis]HJD97763.1 gamma-glutamyltransferase [Mailhella massiliensis]
MNTSYCATVSQSTNPIATHGMVTSPNHLATQAGLDILRRGGNAVDAAIAAAVSLAVVYPHMCTPGGDNFWLIYNAKTGELLGLNASGRAGKKADIDFYTVRGVKKIPAHGYLAANTVPGAVSGWDEAYRFSKTALGTAIPWKALFASALSYAVEGFPVSTSFARWLAINTDTEGLATRRLQRFPEFARVFMKDGRRPSVGDIFRQPDLARTLEKIAEKGAAEFYTGSIAERITDDLAEHDGLLSLEDFAAHKADWVTPIHVDYRDLTACNLPPNTQGMTSLELLNILNNFDINAMGEGSADYYHVLIEATKEALIDRDLYLSDPDFVSIPLDELLSKEHGKAQAARIRMDRAAGPLSPLDPKGDTVWLGVVDGDGNAVSLIQSIYHDFGSGIVAKDTGVLLQNRGSFFSLDPAHVNCLMPGKRTLHTLNPAMLLKNGRPFLVYGTMGGEGQPQTQAAIVTRVVDFGLTPQEAVTAPRWLYGRTWGSTSNNVKLEGRIPAAVAEELARRGHPVQNVQDYTDIMGHAGAILVNPEKGILQGASDPRSDGLAAGY